MESLKICLPANRSANFCELRNNHTNDCITHNKKFEMSDLRPHCTCHFSTCGDVDYNAFIIDQKDSVRLYASIKQEPKSFSVLYSMQKLDKMSDSAMEQSKTTRIGNWLKGRYVECIQTLTKDGTFRVVRTDKSGYSLGGYTFNTLKSHNKFSVFPRARKLQKLGHKIANNSNGCERPILKYIGEFAYRLAAKCKH